MRYRLRGKGNKPEKTMTPAISTQKLSRRFGRTVALDEVDLDVPEGAIYALVGANGAGKTTLIKVLMNIFQPTAGKAQVLGIDSRKVAGRIFNRIGYVSENQQMPDWMTAGDMLAYYRNFYPTWDRALEDRLVRQFDLPVGRKLKHLSRGMRMKAAFASSLAYRPTLIVLDEPFSGLDPLVRDELIEGLIERASETTIFVSSHDLAEIEGLASHVGFLDRGHLLFSQEMNVLSSRFRAVTVTLASPQPLPPNLPAPWLQLESSDSVVRFIDSNFDPESSPASFAATFPAARDIALDAMSLRSIFLAIAKSSRVPDESHADIPTEVIRTQA
jgi:ABC-2 type transport system ATP-binding protein